MIVVTWNVNSIKVRLHAVLQYLLEENPDVLVLQETKSTDENFPISAFSDAGYHVIFCGQKTYNGVAIISKDKPKDVQINPVSTDENEMRSISAIYNGIRVVNLYVVNGQNVDTPKYDYKKNWLKKFINNIEKRLNKNTNLLIAAVSANTYQKDKFKILFESGKIEQAMSLVIDWVRVSSYYNENIPYYRY